MMRKRTMFADCIRLLSLFAIMHDGFRCMQRFCQDLLQLQLAYFSMPLPYLAHALLVVLLQRISRGLIQPVKLLA